MFTHLGTREPISRIVASRIEEAIFSKKYVAGSKLPSEAELCRMFGVSRTSVREALQSLTAQGLIHVIKGKGIFVNNLNGETVTDPLAKYLKLKLDRDYVLDLVRARQIIEPAIAYHAAINRSKEDIDILKKDIEELEMSTGDYVELARLDMHFHLHLANASGNSVIPLILDPIHRLIPEVSSVYATVSDAKIIAVDWHTKIWECIASGSSIEAREAMVQHLKIAEEHAMKMLESRLLLEQKTDEKNK